MNWDGRGDLVVLIDDVAGSIPVGATSVSLAARFVDGSPLIGTDEICLIRY